MGKKLSDEKSLKLRRFLAREIGRDSATVVADATRKFGVSRQTVNNVLKEMLLAGEVNASGNTRARRYSLVVLEQEDVALPLADLDESVVWRTYFAKFFTQHRSTAMELANYSFTEMLNNAIDHSEGESVVVRATRTAHAVRMVVADDGIGIFRKIQRELELDDPRHAILELAKGKLTTDPVNHSGMGIFFTSRACERFAVMADGLFFSHNESRDFLLDGGEPTEGTTVLMEFDLHSTRTMPSVYKEYEAEGARGFKRTIVPVKLSDVDSAPLVSRSQAKRVLSRIDRFLEVVWDFKGVQRIGQAFADEIFRVFQVANPECRFTVVNASADVLAMVRLALATLHEQHPGMPGASIAE